MLGHLAMPRLMLPIPFAAVLAAIVAPILAVALTVPAGADKRPVIFPDGTVVHGDWGLAGNPNVVPYAEYWGPQYYSGPYAPRGYYFPSNSGDPFAYRSRATRQPSVPGPRYNRSWSTESDAPADLPPRSPQGPYVIPAPTPDAK